METKHNQANIKCDNCTETFLNSEALVTHIEKKHTLYQQRERTNSSLIDSQINCIDWSCSFCGERIQGKDRRDNHICQEHLFETVQPQGIRTRKNKSLEECSRGENCRYWRVGTCWFAHAQSVVSPVGAQAYQRSTRRGDMWCAYQDKCDRRQSCTFKHMDEETDFVKNVLNMSRM